MKFTRSVTLDKDTWEIIEHYMRVHRIKASKSIEEMIKRYAKFQKVIMEIQSKQQLDAIKQSEVIKPDPKIETKPTKKKENKKVLSGA